MGERYQKPTQIVPRAELNAALEHALSNHFCETVSIRTLKRRVSDYCSSYLIEELDLKLDNGQRLQLIFKDLSPSALISTARNVKAKFLYEPRREIECYRDLLASHELGTAKYYGAAVDLERSRYWLFLERVSPSLLWQMGDFEIWKRVAGWLAGMHTYLSERLAGKGTIQPEHVLKYDELYYRRWIDRAKCYIRLGDSSTERAAAKAIDWIWQRYDGVVERLRQLPVTLIHGEFYPANVMVDTERGNLRICPVDWEMAGLGPGLMDLSALSSGGWSTEQKESIAFAYLHALPEVPAIWKDRARFLADLDHCRLHQAIVLLGWSEKWEAPPEHAQNWLAEALRIAECLRL